MASRVIDIIRQGVTRYCGERHTTECPDRAQGMWCDWDCADTRDILRELGYPVDAAPYMAWENWSRVLADSIGVEANELG